MRTIICIFFLSILALTVNIAEQKSKEKNIPLQKMDINSGENSLLDFYRQYSEYTDPGEYECLYKDLPGSLPELCELIKSQFIHPFSELRQYRDKFPEERLNEFFRYPTVKSILQGLLSYDSAGLTKERAPENRLLLICRHNAILLASILKHRGIPARVRSGHASYIMPGFHISHTICEVWNKEEKRWMLVDPSMNMVDFDREKFDISNELWLKFQKGEINPDLYGIPHRYTGAGSIVGKVCSDLASILGTEYPLSKYAPILDYTFDKDKELSPEHIKTLNRISELMQSITAENLAELRDIYDKTPFMQMTKTLGSKPE